ncbi:hypothetical protein [Acidianus sp. HS-5]|uniref:hypothetical protein n=1 Tax=Acidianus sp. HS-5 TaxID=2886040 RepID=UPI001F3BC154|nr:hypothetical protein [Acidianus sp. HS-5]BDC17946.1 hypothetical protein HS5_08360 [Acidianus sp. HS-5]
MILILAENEIPEADYVSYFSKDNLSFIFLHYKEGFSKYIGLYRKNRGVISKVRNIPFYLPFKYVKKLHDNYLLLYLKDNKEKQIIIPAIKAEAYEYLYSQLAYTMEYMIDKLKMNVSPEQGKEIIDILKKGDSMDEFYSFKVYRLPEIIYPFNEKDLILPLSPPLEVFKEGFEDNNLF